MSAQKSNKIVVGMHGAGGDSQAAPVQPVTGQAAEARVAGLDASSLRAFVLQALAQGVVLDLPASGVDSPGDVPSSVPSGTPSDAADGGLVGGAGMASLATADHGGSSSVATPSGVQALPLSAAGMAPAVPSTGAGARPRGDSSAVAAPHVPDVPAVSAPPAVLAPSAPLATVAVALPDLLACGAAVAALPAVDVAPLGPPAGVAPAADGVPMPNAMAPGKGAGKGRLAAGGAAVGADGGGADVVGAAAARGVQPVAGGPRLASNRCGEGFVQGNDGGRERFRTLGPFTPIFDCVDGTRPVPGWLAMVFDKQRDGLLDVFGPPKPERGRPPPTWAETRERLVNMLVFLGYCLEPSGGPRFYHQHGRPFTFGAYRAGVHALKLWQEHFETFFESRVFLPDVRMGDSDAMHVRRNAYIRCISPINAVNWLYLCRRSLKLGYLAYVYCGAMPRSNPHSAFGHMLQHLLKVAEHAEYRNVPVVEVLRLSTASVSSRTPLFQSPQEHWVFVCPHAQDEEGGDCRYMKRDEWCGYCHPRSRVTSERIRPHVVDLCYHLWLHTMPVSWRG